jgi:hypothetical protein
MTVPRFKRIAAGDYETADGKYRLVQLDGGRTRAWNVEHGSDWIGRQIDADPENVTAMDFDTLIVDGAATKRDALILFAEAIEGGQA